MAEISQLTNDGKPVPVELHERTIRAGLALAPDDRSSIFSLIHILVASRRPPFPDDAILASAGAWHNSEAGKAGVLANPNELLEIARQQVAAGQQIEAYASLWQATVLCPQSPLPWGEFARLLADAKKWNFALVAARRALTHSHSVDAELAGSLSAILSTVAEMQQAESTRKELSDAPALGARYPLLQLNLPEDASASEISEFKNIADQATALSRAESAHVAAQFLLEKLGAKLVHGRDESQYSEWMNYTLSLLYSSLDEPERSSEIMDNLQLLPAGGGDLLLCNHIELSLADYKRQRSAIESGLPSFLISSMPRSASAFFSQTVSNLLDIPVFRLSLAGTRDYWLMRQWVNSFTPGGGITHDHFGATSFNINVLQKCNIRDVFVLVRDPRASAVSRGKMKYGAKATAALCDYFFVNYYLPWLSSWVAIDEDPDAPVKVHWIRSDEVRYNTAAVVRELFEFQVSSYPALEPYLNVPPPPVSANFNHGDDNRWRDFVPAEMAEQWWSMIPARALELLELRE